MQIVLQLRYDEKSNAQNSCNSVCSKLTASSSLACVCLMLASLYACNCSVRRNKMTINIKGCYLESREITFCPPNDQSQNFDFLCFLSWRELIASFFLLKGQYLFTLHFNEVERIAFVDRYNKVAVHVAALSHSNNSLVFISLSLFSTFYFHFLSLRYRRFVRGFNFDLQASSRS